MGLITLDVHIFTTVNNWGTNEGVPGYVLGLIPCIHVHIRGVLMRYIPLVRTHIINRHLHPALRITRMAEGSHKSQRWVETQRPFVARSIRRGIISIFRLGVLRLCLCNNLKPSPPLYGWLALGSLMVPILPA